MNMISRLTRAQLEALAFVGLLALLWTISWLFNVPAGVDRDLSPISTNQVRLQQQDDAISVNLVGF
jgi:hypothetical protein